MFFSLKSESLCCEDLDFQEIFSCFDGFNNIKINFPVVVPERTATNNFVSIFDLSRKQFLCTDSSGQLIHSVSLCHQVLVFSLVNRRSLDCFLRSFRLNLAKRREVFPSPRSKQLLKQGGGDVPNREPPGARRRRRSKEVNPSDPLMSETHPSLPAKDGDKSQPDQDQAGAVSKETITSCDDPLRVLRPNGAGSPVKTNIADRAEHS
uniref:Uncharacterized protein n=1 Tax=Oryzias melastigma TaxID=30732 RepID=A0A3B3DVW1_ORYME